MEYLENIMKINSDRVLLILLLVIEKSKVFNYSKIVEEPSSILLSISLYY